MTATPAPIDPQDPHAGLKQYGRRNGRYGLTRARGTMTDEAARIYEAAFAEGEALAAQEQDP